ncbi:fumarate/nitrate reduction transcriptional regulator Fnr [Dasania sp. GY-MA-18]|uniref:Fumarate/nitrate reduction transcriptional regulator Fnr n=1 Tax=Dasania phycosphaerae TaxID=2950436 RepID=A0A9J6RP54_9GAMM|nr:MULTISPECIES: fumarate/nitrate reduction transcriptional regulator Fnr [Dasania]MCR8923655.1 fumarate/nitrate reduction transcriptional regulator Fnr [Dasania sp. GY-MA-18]MCZ0866089.1 fumarate/nitrate reduction transcriptional regulator Fnr [Dasania phycosphaerae]MCZ0869813.1 fumarate/nitrate reduction transcriptional regulator Fnr [Dasania phycosphaerae]
MSNKLASSAKLCPHNNQISCNDCRLGSICLPLAMHEDDIIKLDEIVQRGRPLAKNAHIYRKNDPFTAVYAVRSGSVKTYRLTNDGQEQVTGFYFPGEIIGMDGIGTGHYANAAKTLETAAICEIPFDRLESLSTEIPNMQRHFFQLMSQEITSDQQLITLLSKNSAEERIAALLISISARMVRRKLSGTQFRLPMSRTDIGNYLGLTIETVSRVFSRFKKQNLVDVDGKEISLKDLEALKEIADM